MSVLRTIVGCTVLPLIAAACGCTAREASVDRQQPIEDELFTIVEHERVIPANVGVERRIGPRVELVPEFQPVEPTDEERAILGDQTDPLDQLFTFYQPAPGSDEGVLPLDGVAAVGTTVYIDPAGGVLLQRYSGGPGVDVSAHEVHGWLVHDRSSASVLLADSAAAGVFTEVGGEVGEGEARTSAGRLPAQID